MKRLFMSYALLLFVGGLVVSSSANADEVCRNCPFDCQGIGSGKKDCRDLPYRGNECCVDLNNRGLDQLRRKDLENQYGSNSNIIRPSCPPGSTFNGQHCVINDKSKIRPGGKGTINPCPNGMHLAGDRCL